jgi:hypothetical protein
MQSAIVVPCTKPSEEYMPDDILHTLKQSDLVMPARLCLEQGNSTSALACELLQYTKISHSEFADELFPLL